MSGETDLTWESRRLLELVMAIKHSKGQIVSRQQLLGAYQKALSTQSLCSSQIMMVNRTFTHIQYRR